MVMRKSRFTEEQIAHALRQAETGTEVTEVCRAMGISEQTYYVWKKRYARAGRARDSPAQAARGGEPAIEAVGRRSLARQAGSWPRRECATVTSASTSCSGARAGGSITSECTGSIAWKG